MDNSAIDERLSRSELRDVDYALEVCFAAGKCGAEGTPEAVASIPGSFTGHFLQPLLSTTLTG